MKKLITMILTLAIIISGMAVSANTSNAEMTPGTETPSVEATATPVPTVEPEEDEVEHYRIEWRNRYDRRKDYDNSLYRNGGIIHTAKKHTLLLGLEDNYKGSVKWTSSKPSVASVSANGVVKCKKIGSTKITAEYNGLASYIFVKVKKNKYSAKVKTFKDNEGKRGSGITSMYFDKKGNLIFVYTDKLKLTKYGRKAWKKYAKYRNGKYGWYQVSSVIIPSKRKGWSTFADSVNPTVVIKDRSNRIVAKKKMEIKYKKAKPNNLTTNTKFKIKKKYLRKKEKDVYLPECEIELLDGRDKDALHSFLDP